MLFIAAAMFLCGCLLDSGRVYISRHCLYVIDLKHRIVGASNRSVVIVVAPLVALMVGIEKCSFPF